MYSSHGASRVLLPFLARLAAKTSILQYEVSCDRENAPRLTAEFMRDSRLSKDGWEGAQRVAGTWMLTMG